MSIRPLGTVCSTFLACQAARGQVEVRVTHDDPDGVVTPGQTVQFTVLMDWEPSTAVMWHMTGNLLASPNAGLALNPEIGLAILPGTLPQQAILMPGTPSGGSIFGFELFSSMTLQVGGGWVFPPWNQSTNVPILEFDWIAPGSPGRVDFGWQPAGVAATPLFNMNNATGPISSLSTTYSGASLVVVPSPASIATLLVARTACLRRRR